MLRQKLVQKDDNTSGKDDTKGNEPSADAEVLADFRKGATSLFEASDGWTNGNPFDCGWTKNNTSFDNGVLNLTIDKDQFRVSITILVQSTVLWTLSLWLLRNFHEGNQK